MKVLVCGGRDYGMVPFDICPRAHEAAQARATKQREVLKAKMFQLKGQGMTFLIHGGARGADDLAGQWAEVNGVPQDVYWADWERYGKPAGIIRNRKMLEVGCPDLVVAFPGGRGTQDMVRRATEAGVPVERVPAP